MLAAQGGHTEIVEALIEAGAVVNKRNWVSFSSKTATHSSRYDSGSICTNSTRRLPLCWLLKVDGQIL